MALIHRKRPDRLDWVRVDVPEMFRRMFDPDTEDWLRVEELVDGDTLIVRAELPGIDPDEDVELSIADGLLHIWAQRTEKAETKDEGTYRSEFRYGSFARTVALPEGVDADAITATYNDGILEVRAPLPAPAEKPVTKVPIARG